MEVVEAESRRMTKKITKGKILQKKKAISLEKNSCINLSNCFTEILAVRNREQIGVRKLSYSKASVQSRCLLKTTSKFFI